MPLPYYIRNDSIRYNMQLYRGRWLALPDDDGIAIRAENKQVIRQCLFEALTLILSIFNNKFSFELLNR